jgi:uncharacterized protein YqgC (DUF456 family)
MPWFFELVIAFVLFLGFIGIVIPGFPGLGLMWLTIAIWTFADGGGATRIWIFAIATVLALIGEIAGFALPAKAVKDSGATKTTWLYAAAGAGIGFVAIPGIGLFVGFIIGVYLYFASIEPGNAMAPTIKTIKAFGLSILLQAIIGAVIAFGWIVGLLLT